MTHQKFAKIYETEEYGQILVCMDSVDGDYAVSTSLFQGEAGITMAHMMVGSYEEMVELFDAFTFEIAVCAAQDIIDNGN